MAPLLDRFDEDDKGLASLFNSPMLAQILAQTSRGRQIIELLERFQSNEQRIKAAKLAFSAMSKSRQSESDKLKDLRVYLSNLKDPLFRLHFAIDRIRMASTQTPTNQRIIQAAFDEVVATKGKLTNSDLTELMRQPAIIELLSVKDNFDWFCEQLTQLNIEDRYSVLRRISYQTGFMEVLIGDEGTRFFVLIDQILAVDDDRYREIASSVVSRLRSDPRSPTNWMYTGLIFRLQTSDSDGRAGG